MKQNLNIGIELVSVTIGPKAVSIKIEISGIPVVGKQIVEKMVSYDQFLDMLPGFAGTRLDAVRKTFRIESATGAKERKKSKKPRTTSKAGQKKLAADWHRPGEEKLKKAVAKEEIALDEKGYFKIGTVFSPAGRPRKVQTEVYLKGDSLYAKSLTSKRKKMYSLKIKDYKRIMDVVSVITEPVGYISLQERLKVSLGVNPNRFYVWTCVARAFFHIEESYDKDERMSKIMPTGKFAQMVEQLKEYGSH